jgi:hypothetical protein
MHLLYKICIPAYGYGLVRNSILASNIPLKKDELYTERVGKVIFSALGTPILFPTLIMNDIGNIERKFRGMKTDFIVPFIS